MRATATVLLTFFLLIAAGRNVSAQVTYRQIVDRYRTSPNDGVELMLALSESSRQEAIQQAVSASGADAWSWEELAGAGMMHTDAAFYFLARKQPGIGQLTDAERLIARGLTTRAGHWDFGDRWYRTVQAVLKGYGDTANAQLFFKRFTDLYLARFKETPQRIRALDAYHRGVMNEYDGCQKGEFLTITGLTESGGNLISRYFVPAGRELEGALTLDPELLGAALHLGRVRLLENREADAVKYLQQAADAPSRPIGYLAKLFLGAIAERASKWDEAEAAYRGAVKLFPTAQSGIVALTQFLDRRGRPADAAALIQSMLAPTTSRTVDPWWLYFEEAGAENSLKIGLMRAEVLK